VRRVATEEVVVTVGNMPAAEVDVDEPLLGRLLAEQHPDLAGAELRLLASGWDNVLYRVGPDLVARLPRRQVAAALVDHEQRWLPEIAARLPLPVPAPVRVGRPGAGYPWRWSLCPWLAGEPAALAPLADAADAARVLGSFVAALHVPAPANAPANPVRGVPLAARSAAFEARLAKLGRLVDGAGAREVWRAASDAPPWAGPPLWLHGDLHPANVLVADGRLAAVIDFGDLTAGDPATDLAAAWMLFEPGARAVFRDCAGDVDDATWCRARGWAVGLSVAILASSADNELMAAVARRTLAAASSDEWTAVHRESTG
jgi:aminoglycoside phosphotransferase (APT) family kinase protein